jgi:hypothetical protein
MSIIIDRDRKRHKWKLKKAVAGRGGRLAFVTVAWVVEVGILIASVC